MNKFKKFVTPDGVNICYVKNSISKVTLVDVLFNCGARCDTIPGLAHFTEHMFLSGTKDLTKEQITKKYFDLVNVDMYTNAMEIIFSGSVFTNEFANFLSTVATMITESPFAQSAVNKEIGIVQQEIARYADKYNRKAYYFNRYCMCGDDVSKFGILGTKDTVASIKSKDVKAFVKKYFVKENMEIYVSSPLSFSRVKKLISKNLTNKIPSNKKFEKLPLYYHYATNTDFLEVKNDKIDKSYVRLNFFNNFKYQETEEKIKIDMVLRMMNNFSDGVMKDLRLKKSLVYSGGFSSSYTDRDGLMTFDTECDVENINEVLSTISSYIDNIGTNGFTQAQLDNAKRELSYSEDSAEPRVSKSMSRLYQFKFLGKVVDSEKLLKKAKKITLEECNNLFKDLFLNNKVALAVYGNAEKKNIMSKKEFNKLFRSH